MNEERITYKQGVTRQEFAGYVKAAMAPISVFFLIVFILSRFGAFGKNIMAPWCAIIWGIGVVAAWKVPSQRRETLSHTYIMLAGYCSGLLLFKILIGLAANTSSEQLMATYSQAMPTSTGSTIAGYLQSMLWILAFIAPISFVTMQAKKLVSFRRTKAKNKVLEQIRNIRE